MVGKTPRALKNERVRMETIKQHCGCLPCLLMGFLDVHTSIEHVTKRGRRVGSGSDVHKWTIGLCAWHHFGHGGGPERGPSLALGRVPFEELFGDEVKVMVPTQDFLLDLFDRAPWPEYSLPRNIARLTRNKWIELNNAS